METEVNEILSQADQALMDRNWEATEQLWRSLAEDKGFILIRLVPTSKEPLEKRWRTKVYHKAYEEIGLQASMNAGIVCGPESGIIVLDVDDVEKFELLGLEVPETFTVQSGKGFHYYFKIPAENGEQYRNRARGIYDIRATMGYVVAPGSIHPSGKVYTLVKDIPPVEAPQWLLDASKDDEKKVKRIAGRKAQTESCSPASKDLQEVDIEKLKLPAKIYELITEGVLQGDDRSKADFGVVISLLRAGCNEAQIRWIFSNYPISEKSDGHPDKFGYLQTTIDNAYEVIEEELTTGRQWQTMRIPQKEELDIHFRTLAEYATRDLMEILASHGNKITKARHSDLETLVRTYAAMANRKLQGRVAFPLPTGYGKTTSIVAFLARAADMSMLGREKDASFSIAITAFKVEELCNLYGALQGAMERLGVEDPSQFISLSHSYKYRNGETGVNLASMPATTRLDSNGTEILDTLRPILLLTHNKAKSKGNVDFKKLIEKRTLLIWDESMLSTEAGSVSVKRLHSGIAHLEFTSQLSGISVENFLKTHYLNASARYLKACYSEVVEEIAKQTNGIPKSILKFDTDCEIPIGDIIDILSELIKDEDQDDIRQSLAELRDFTRITMFEASVELGKADKKDHTIVRFDIVMPDSVENIVVLDASTWINELMKLDKTMHIPEGVNPSLRYDGTTIHRIDFNSGRGEIEKELQSNEHGLLDTIEEIVSRHPGEAILFFTPKVKGEVDCRGLVENHLAGKEYDLMEAYEDKLRFNWLTHGNYTASNSFSHCTVMIFVGMLHKPQHVYRAETIAQTRDLTTTITRADECRIKEAIHATDAHQGINRGAGRVIKGDVTTPVNAYYTYLNDNLVRDLQTVMPGVDHKRYETLTLKPRTKYEGAVRATRMFLLGLPESTKKASKAMVNREVREMEEASRDTRLKVAKAIEEDPDVPWKSDGRSWIRMQE